MLEKRQAGDPLRFAAADWNTIVDSVRESQQPDPYQPPAAGAVPYDVCLALNIYPAPLQPFEPCHIVSDPLQTPLGYGGYDDYLAKVRSYATPGVDVVTGYEELIAAAGEFGQAPWALNWLIASGEEQAAHKVAELLRWVRQPMLWVMPTDQTYRGLNQQPRPYDPQRPLRDPDAGGAAAPAPLTNAGRPPTDWEGHDDFFAGNSWPASVNGPFAIVKDAMPAFDFKADNFTPGKVVTSGIFPVKLYGPPRVPTSGALYARPTARNFLVTSPVGAAEILHDPLISKGYEPPPAPDWPPSEPNEEGKDPDAGRIAIVRLGTTPQKQMVMFKLFTSCGDELPPGANQPYQFSPWWNRDEHGRAKAWILRTTHNWEPVNWPFTSTVGSDHSSPIDENQPIGECGVIDPAGLFENAFPGAVGVGLIDLDYSTTRDRRENHSSAYGLQGGSANMWTPGQLSRPTVAVTSVQQYATRAVARIAAISGRYLNSSDRAATGAGNNKVDYYDDPQLGIGSGLTTGIPGSSGNFSEFPHANERAYSGDYNAKGKNFPRRYHPWAVSIESWSDNHCAVPFVRTIPQGAGDLQQLQYPNASTTWQALDNHRRMVRVDCSMAPAFFYAWDIGNEEIHTKKSAVDWLPEPFNFDPMAVDLRALPRCVIEYHRQTRACAGPSVHPTDYLPPLEWWHRKDDNTLPVNFPTIDDPLVRDTNYTGYHHEKRNEGFVNNHQHTTRAPTAAGGYSSSGTLIDAGTPKLPPILDPWNWKVVACEPVPGERFADFWHTHDPDDSRYHTGLGMAPWRDYAPYDHDAFDDHSHADLAADDHSHP